jgi:peptidoglycan/LPS O-acetylase OafA/YrhL
MRILDIPLPGMGDLEINLSDRRYPFLDVIRAASIRFIVFFAHLFDYFETMHKPQWVSLATSIFLSAFVFVSGLSLSANYPEILTSQVIQFFKKRFIRIYPLYAISVLLFIIAGYVQEGDVLAHLFLVKIILGKSAITIWFVSMICVYYAIYPLICNSIFLYSFVAKRLIIYLIAILIEIGFGLLNKRLIFFMPVFFFGMLFPKFKQFESIIKSRLFLIFTASLLFFFILIHSHTNLPAIKYFSFQATLILSIPLCVAISSYLVNYVRTYRIVYGISYASFCLYLFHRIVYNIAYNMVPSDHNSPVIILMLVAIFVLIYFASFFAQKTYDSLLDRIT